MTPKPLNPRGRGKRGYTVKPEMAAEMHAYYSAGHSLMETGAKYGRDFRAISDIFRRRGLAIRQVPMPKKDPNTGCFAPYVPHTAQAIQAMIEAATVLKVPDALKQEWRHWNLERRSVFIRALRAKLGIVPRRPTGPFIGEIEPFDYSSAKAHALAKKLNEGRTSQTKAVQIRLQSEGVIWREQLWFWFADNGYCKGPFDRVKGQRETIHRLLWEEARGPVPKGHVIRFVDGNRNHLILENLRLATRNELARENQAAHIARRSRALTAALFTPPTTTVSHELSLHSLHSLRA